jgi:hypothetical protein
MAFNMRSRIRTRWHWATLGSPTESELKQNIINLHVWAEPACNIPRNHVSEGFRGLVGMLPGLDLAIHPSWDVDLPEQREAFPPNVGEEEKEVLRERCNSFLRCDAKQSQSLTVALTHYVNTAFRSNKHSRDSLGSTQK